jgi:TetR/AcrR family transcriptional regulator, cholesterol catabolism regulator
MDKRQEIYEKALELFISHGYDQTPLSMIAKALGITKAGLYHYFSSKEELLFFIHQQNMKKDLIPIIESAEKIADPKERITYIIKKYTESSMARDPSQKMLIHELGNLAPEHRTIIRESWRKFFDIIRNTISELETSGQSKKINQIFATFALIGMCRWTFNWYDPSKKDSAQELVDTYSEIFFRGILKE